jgi:hypothetical protein
MQSCSRSRSQTSQAPFLSPQPPPHTPARRTLVSLNTPSPRASTINLLKIKGSLTDPAPIRRRSALGHVGLLSPRVFLLLNFVGRPTCLTSMRTATCLIRPLSPTQNRWHFRYPSMTLLIILTSHLRLWTILTALRPLVTRSRSLQNYAAQCAAA